MRQIQETEIEKLSAATGVAAMDLTKLHDMGLLNQPHAVDILIRCDYKRLLASRAYTVKQIVQALSNHYNVPASRVTQAMYLKKKKEDVCKVCGKPTTKASLRKNHGMCHQCCVMSIKV